VLRGRAEVDVESSVAGGVARAAAERNNGERRTAATKVRRMNYLLGVNSNHHDHKLNHIQLST
jgi:hypothetical protein